LISRNKLKGGETTPFWPGPLDYPLQVLTTQFSTTEGLVVMYLVSIFIIIFLAREHCYYFYIFGEIFISCMRIIFLNYFSIFLCVINERYLEESKVPTYSFVVVSGRGGPEENIIPFKFVKDRFKKSNLSKDLLQLICSF
jgi:hypothetical protein